MPGDTAEIQSRGHDGSVSLIFWKGNDFLHRIINDADAARVSEGYIYRIRDFNDWNNDTSVMGRIPDVQMCWFRKEERLCIQGCYVTHLKTGHELAP
jgi:hypothetical protein